MIDESSGKIAVCGGPDVFVYQPYGIQGETLKVRTQPALRGPNYQVFTWRDTIDIDTWVDLVVPPEHVSSLR